MNDRLEEAKRLFSLARRDQRAFTALSAHCSEEDFPVAAFHAQQAIEKSLKAVLCLLASEYKCPHDLIELAGRLADLGQALPIDEINLYRLTPYAVELRYDEMAIALITPSDATAAVAQIIDWCQKKLESA